MHVPFDRAIFIVETTSLGAYWRGLADKNCGMGNISRTLCNARVSVKLGPRVDRVLNDGAGLGELLANERQTRCPHAR